MVLYEIARRALGGPGDEGRASYQLAVTRCPECLRVSVEAGGRSHEVDDAVAEMVACDGQQVGLVDGRAEPTGPHVGVGAARETDSDAVPATSSSPHVIAQVQATSVRHARATQTIAPATRRAVMRRHRGRCSVPGCSNHRFLDVHHVIARAEGGGHDPGHLAVLCGPHHRAVHQGRLVVEGTASEGFSFRHADGTVYGGRLRPEDVEAATQVLGALEHLGFGANRARALVEEARKRGAPEGREALLRAALLLA
jgi:hypothetical protein